MRIYGITDVGIIRDNNQDNFRIVSDNGLSLCVVCDGMGGAAGGFTASNTACDAFVSKVFDGIHCASSPDDYSEIMVEALKHANNTVFTLARTNKELSGMGTTLCAVLTDGSRAWTVSVGDSRIYMFKDGEAIQISHDHSYVQVLIDCGAITKEESRTHPRKNIITRAVGTNENVECDSMTLDPLPDGFLICSDGLSNYVTENDLKSVFSEHSQDEKLLADTLINMANAAGGSDNITAIVIISD